MSIDYARMSRTHRTHKARLTRALNTTDPAERAAKVKAACVAAVTEWNEIGCWPDDWSRWQRALDDAYPAVFGGFVGPDLLTITSEA